MVGLTRLLALLPCLIVLQAACAEGEPLNSTNFGGAAGVDSSATGGGTQAGGSNGTGGGSSQGTGGSPGAGGSGGSSAGGSVGGGGTTGSGGASDGAGIGGSAGASEASARGVDATNDISRPDVANDVVNEVGSINDARVGDVGAREAGDGGPVVEAGLPGPCTGLCANPIVFTPLNPNYNSGPLGTMASCHQTTLPFQGIVCGNFAPNRTFTINGTPFACDGTGRAPGAARNGGYCFQASTAVTETSAYFGTY